MREYCLICDYLNIDSIVCIDIYIYIYIEEKKGGIDKMWIERDELKIHKNL